ncbi:putative polynucleotide phosphatase/kinase-like protein, partial [Gregarina niphandrodes]
GVPLVVVASHRRDEFRKPRIGILEVLETHFGKSISSGAFVGDAAGRPKDFSASDRKFAMNARWRFFIPEAFFCDKPQNLPPLPFDPIGMFNSITTQYILDLIKPEELCDLTSVKVLVMMIGSPASGKSFLSRQLSEKYNLYWINQDTLKTKPRCLKAIQEAVYNKNGAVLDLHPPDRSDASTHR